MTDRKGDWMQTYTGKMFWPVDPRAEEVDIDDIAHALSMLCRYGGHTKKFYSVAEHSCHLFDYANDENKMWALLHDASEAYITDIIRPLKPYLSDYKSYESAVMKVICEKFGLPTTPPDQVKKLDNRILNDELAQAMVRPPRDWAIDGDRLHITLQFWSPDKAEKEFLDRYYAVVHQSLGSITQPPSRLPPVAEPNNPPEPRIVRAARRGATLEAAPAYYGTTTVSATSPTLSRVDNGNPLNITMAVTADPAEQGTSTATFRNSTGISSAVRVVSGTTSTASGTSLSRVISSSNWATIGNDDNDTVI